VIKDASAQGAEGLGLMKNEDHQVLGNEQRLKEGAPDCTRGDAVGVECSPEGESVVPPKYTEEEWGQIDVPFVDPLNKEIFKDLTDSTRSIGLDELKHDPSAKESVTHECKDVIAENEQEIISSFGRAISTASKDLSDSEALILGEEMIQAGVHVEDNENCKYLQLWKNLGILLLIFVLVGYINKKKLTTIDETAMAETSKDMEEGKAPPISLAAASPEVKPLAGAVVPAPATSKDGDALGDSTEDAGVAAEVSAAAANPTKAINRSARICVDSVKIITRVEELGFWTSIKDKIMHKLGRDMDLHIIVNTPREHTKTYNCYKNELVFPRSAARHLADVDSPHFDAEL
ncbi:hypothetical protein Tco_0385820, partial [Tanacetum coccineum]